MSPPVDGPPIEGPVDVMPDDAGEIRFTRREVRKHFEDVCEIHGREAALAVLRRPDISSPGDTITRSMVVRCEEALEATKRGATKRGIA